VIYSALADCGVFADIGCDHGYVSELMAKNRRAQKIYAADISTPSLEKAEKLLAGYSCVTTVVSDGFDCIPERAEQALIAGMGGEEIIKILSAAGYKPERLVLQPMKNTDKLRSYLNKNGYKLLKDFTFKDGKFYDLVVAERGEESLSADEIKYGKDNVRFRPAAFTEKLRAEYENITDYLKRPLGESSRDELLAKKADLERFL